MFETILKNAGFNQPFDIEAELSVVRMMLHSEQALSYALGSLTSEAFHDEDHPSLRTLYESGSSDIVIFLHKENQLPSRECDLGKTKVIVAKNTNGDIGEFYLTFNQNDAGWKNRQRINTTT